MNTYIIKYSGQSNSIYGRAKWETEIDAKCEDEARAYFARFYPAAEILTIKEKGTDK